MHHHIEAAERAAVASDDPQVRGGVLDVRAIVLRDGGDLAGARALQARATEMLADIDPTEIRASLFQLGLDDLALGDFTAALQSFERVRELYVAANDDERIAASELAMARALWQLGERDRARALAENALATWRRLGVDDGVAEGRAWLAQHRR
jgi:tetratricopeptide (TPR) repeat protein